MSFVSLWGPVILQMAIIFGASSLTEPGLPGGVSDKSGHFFGYLLLAALLVRALAKGRVAGITRQTIVLGALGAILYGLSDEFHQGFVPGRSPDPADLVADGLGAAAGGALCGIVALVCRSWRGDPPQST